MIGLMSGTSMDGVDAALLETDGEDAVLFDPDDANAFTDAIVRMCGDDELRKRLGHAAATLIEKKEYTWTANARRVEEMARAE